MNASLETFLTLVNAINKITDDLIVAGSLGQFLHLNQQHRVITDIDIILFNDYKLHLNINEINRVLGTDYQLSSCYNHHTTGYKVKLVKSTITKDKKEFKEYVSIDVKTKIEFFETIKEQLRIIKFEQLLCNKIATALIGNNRTHYLRVKDLYDLNFLLGAKEYDYDFMIYLLCKRIANNGITNIFDTFLFQEGTEPIYRECFEKVRDKYEMHEDFDLFLVKSFLREHNESVNRQLQKANVKSGIIL